MIQSALQCEVLDEHEASHRVDDLLGAQATLMVFVRHFGCIGCDQQMSEVTPLFGEVAELGVQSIVIGCGPPRYLAQFIDEYKLREKPVRVFTDPDAHIQCSLKLKSSFMHSWGPVAGWDLLVALMRGYKQGMVSGRSLQHGGTFLIAPPQYQPQIRYAYRNQRLTDMAPLHEIYDACFNLSVEMRPLFN